jgi:hypothetical protein
MMKIMKTKFRLNMAILTLLGLIVSPIIWAQQSIPNGSFEDWDVKTILTPTGYLNSEIERFENAPMGTCDRVTDAQNGNYAIKLTSRKLPNASDVMPGYFVNYQPGDGPPNEWHGGIPYNEKPTGIRGYYKSDFQTPGDSALILLIFSKNGVNIGSYFFMIGNIQKTAYAQFQYTLNPPLSQTPDSIIFGAVSSNIINEIAFEGSMLQLDNVSLTGVTNQPANFNGNFENWTNVEKESPAHWKIETSNESQSPKATDKYKGNYALKLVSTMWQDGSMSGIEESTASTGYYSQTGMDGGFPFTNYFDTIAIWYKYTTAGNSKGAMYYTFKKNGNIIGGKRVELDPWNTGYKAMEIPIDATWQGPPDTLIVSFSTIRNDMDQTNLMNNGSTLIVDEVQLKSQKLNTGLSSHWKLSNVNVYPNPSKETIHISIPESELKGNTYFVVLNQLGQEIAQVQLNKPETQASLQGIQPGVYHYTIRTDSKTLKTGKLLIE